MAPLHLAARGDTLPGGAPSAGDGRPVRQRGGPSGDARAEAVRAGQDAAAWYLLSLRAGRYPGLTVRSAVDQAWVAGQLARRSAFIASIAEALGLDPAEALRRWRSGGLGDPS